MRRALTVSILLGLAWNLVVAFLMGGGWRGGLQLAWVAAGAAAGAAAGGFTVWSRRRAGGAERLLDGVLTYYLGMIVYWAVFVVLERLRLCVVAGQWTDFDLADHLGLIGVFLSFGTFWCGPILIPLCLLSRRLVWRVYATGRVVGG